MINTSDRILRGIKPNPKKDRSYRRIRPYPEGKDPRTTRMAGSSLKSRRDKYGNERLGR